jgi:hypothetical protein
LLSPTSKFLLEAATAETNSIPHPKNYRSPLDRRALAKRNQGLSFCIDQNEQTSLTAIAWQLAAWLNPVGQRNFCSVLQ